MYIDYSVNAPTLEHPMRLDFMVNTPNHMLKSNFNVHITFYYIFFITSHDGYSLLTV